MRILVVEDSVILRESIVLGLRKSGHVVDEAADGEDGLWLADGGEYDVIVLDLGLPKLDGMLVLDSLRAAGSVTPVLILTARDGVDDRVSGLRAGADDYLVKPFSFVELVARIEALHRRSKNQATNVLTVDGLVLDLAAKEATLDGVPLALPRREFALLEILALNAGTVVTRTDIEARLYDHQIELSSNVVDAAVSILRKTLLRGENAPRIVTHRGVGYRMAKA